MAPVVNFSTTNPAQLIDRVSELQQAVTLDELNNIQRQHVTAAGAIAWGGLVLLQTGAASAISCPAPIPGSQLNSGQDFSIMKIVALDAHAYVITFPADTYIGSDDTATFGGAIGDSIELIAFNGLIYPVGTALGVTWSEV
jgi:hypothetical protein